MFTCIQLELRSREILEDCTAQTLEVILGHYFVNDYSCDKDN